MDILIVKTSSLGDVVHNLPMVSDIYAQYPGARIDWLIEKAFADIPALHPAVHTVIPVTLRQWLRAPWERKTWQELRALRKVLRKKPYDLILDSQGLLKSAALGRLGVGPLFGSDRRSAREPLAAWLYTKGVAVRWEQHAVWRNRSLAAGVFGYALPTTPPNYGLLAPPPLAHWPQPACVALHASSRDSKLWPEDRWVLLGKRLAQRGLITLLPSGSDQEQERAQRIAASIGSGAQALPRMRVRELAGILGSARVIIGVDTGLVHLAAALSRPTIGIFCDSDPGQTGVLAETGAINLGGFGAKPSVDDVLQSAESLSVLPPP